MTERITVTKQRTVLLPDCQAAETIDFEIKKIDDTETWIVKDPPIVRYCKIGNRYITVSFRYGKMFVEGCKESFNPQAKMTLPKCHYQFENPAKELD